MIYIRYLLLIAIIISISGCSGCAKSGRGYRNRKDTSHIESQPNSENLGTSVEGKGRSVIPIKFMDSGIYEIQASVNGISMKFILDTGASNVSMSRVEADFLIKQGSIDQTDILEDAQMVDANGVVTTVSMINLKKVRLGTKTLNNVRAVVVDNQKAPLLLGQSVLQQFGTYTIDNKRNVLILE